MLTTLARDGIRDGIRDRHFTFLTPAVTQNRPLGLCPVSISEGIGKAANKPLCADSAWPSGTGRELCDVVPAGPALAAGWKGTDWGG
jgi:hypothetical protein